MAGEINLGRLEGLSRLRYDAGAIHFASKFLSDVLMTMFSFERRMGDEYRFENSKCYGYAFDNAAKKITGHRWGSEVEIERAWIDPATIWTSETVTIVYEVVPTAAPGRLVQPVKIDMDVLIGVMAENQIPNLLKPLPVWQSYHIGASKVLLDWVEKNYALIVAELRQQAEHKAESDQRYRDEMEQRERAQLATLLAKYPDVIPTKKARKRLFGKTKP